MFPIVAWRDNGTLDILRRGKGKEATYSSATKVPTTTLPLHTKRIPTTCTPIWHTKWRHELGGRHAALISWVEAFAAHRACAEIIGATGIHPGEARGHIAVESR